MLFLFDFSHKMLNSMHNWLRFSILSRGMKVGQTDSHVGATPILFTNKKIMYKFQVFIGYQIWIYVQTGRTKMGTIIGSIDQLSTDTDTVK